MYPAATSLIPAQIALVRFLENQGIGAIAGNYPYWYFGTTPYHYLTGPVIPTLLLALHRFFPSINLEQIFLFLILIGWLAGGVGLFLLVRNLGGNKLVSGISSFFYLFGFITPFLFRLSDGLYLISFSFVMFILLLYRKYLEKETKKITIILVTSLLIVILINTLILSTIIFGMISLIIVRDSWEDIETVVKKTILLLLAAIGISTIWYTPGYWLTLLGAPSLAGNGLLGVIGMLGKLLPIVLAFGMAIYSAKFLKKRNSLRDFTFIWLFLFGFLTFLRFLSDPDFWLDWTAYGMELQLGVGILGALLAPKILGRLGKLGLLGILGGWGVVFALIFNRYVLGTFQKDPQQSLEYKISQKLNAIVKPGEKVFASGTTAFWLNSYFDISQVRGGVDQASVDRDWRKFAWELKEGVDVERTIIGLKNRGVRYLIVNDSFSKAYYHDFNYPEFFENNDLITKIDDDNEGNYIYMIK